MRPLAYELALTASGFTRAQIMPLISIVSSADISAQHVYIISAEHLAHVLQHLAKRHSQDPLGVGSWHVKH